jgi:hypothetical protein
MARARTGSVEKRHHKDGSAYYRVRVRLADGSRVRVDVPAKYASDERAEIYALAVQEREDERGELLAKKKEREGARVRAQSGEHDETCNAYREWLFAIQKAEGKRTVRRERSFWHKWVEPTIGARPVAAVTSEEIEDIRDRLDAAVRKRIATGFPHGLGGKSAMNVWSVLRTTFKEAVSSRDRSMRLRRDDPTAGINRR